MADAESQERRDQRIVDLEGQVEHQASKADMYQGQLNALQSSFDRITRALGFNTAEELESLVLGDRTIWNRRSIEWNAKRLPILKDEIKAAKERVSDLESEGEARAKQLKEREEEVEVLQKELASTHSERDTATADLTTARSALSSADKQYDDACNEIATVRNSHDSLRAKYVSLQVCLKQERALRKTDIKRLETAHKMGGGALHHAAQKILVRHRSKHVHLDSDSEVKFEATDSDGAPLSPIAKGKGKETRVSSVTGIDSSPTSTPTVFGTSSVPNTPIKPRRTAAAEAPLPTTASAFGPGPSTAALFSAADTFDAPPSSYTLAGLSPRAPLRRSPRKSTLQKRKRPTDENEDGDENGRAAPSSPRSDVSATQDETQAPPLQFTPTKRARRTDELPTSLPRPLNALVLSASRDPSSATTPAGRDSRLAPESLPPPLRNTNVLGATFPRMRPATSPRRTANTKRTDSLSLGSPGKATVSPKVLRTYSKQLKRSALRKPDTTFEEKKVRKRGRYSAPEPSTSRAQLGGADDTEEEETDDEGRERVFKYDEVVRGKRRKELDAEDCEECREYYEAIGPMPPRLQAPLWRSPPSSPQHQHHVHHHHQHRHEHEPKPAAVGKNRGGKVETTRTRNDEDYDADFDAAFFAHQSEAQRGKLVDSHKQQISRHRAMFARAKTPPGYWDIGFPSTPKVDALNKEAYEMHMKKEGTNKKR